MALKDFGRHLSVDPRVVNEISRSPTMSGEQGPGFMSDYGGAQMYQRMSREPENIRMIYYAITEGGATTSDEIANLTSIDIGEVESGITVLEKKGLISRSTIVRQSGL